MDPLEERLLAAHLEWLRKFEAAVARSLAGPPLYLSPSEIAALNARQREYLHSPAPAGEPEEDGEAPDFIIWGDDQ